MLEIQRVAAADVIHVIRAIRRHRVVIDAVVEASKANRRSFVIRLAGVAELGIEDHLDPRTVQRFHHVAELADVRTAFGIGAVRMMRREEADAAVAPVQMQGRATRAKTDNLGIVEVHDRHQLNGRDAQGREVQNLLDDPSKGARRVRLRTGMPGEPSHVQFVDDEVCRRPIERLVAFPVVVGTVDHHAAQGTRQVVLGVRSSVAVPERIGNPSRVRIDQHLVPVEPVAIRNRSVRTVDTYGVMGPRWQSLHDDMPEVSGSIELRGERDLLKRLRVVTALEEEQFHARCVLREEREVDAARRHGRAERHRQPGLDVEGAVRGYGNRRFNASVFGQTYGRNPRRRVGATRKPPRSASRSSVIIRLLTSSNRNRAFPVRVDRRVRNPAF